MSQEILFRVRETERCLRGSARGALLSLAHFFKKAGHEQVFQISFSAPSHEIGRTVNALGIHGNGLTPHALRRDGATWHFGLSKSLDGTSAYGRWAVEATARHYVSHAMADMQHVTLSEDSLSRILKLRQVLPYLASAQR